MFGVLAGLFFGEPMGMLRVVGDAYVGLLQMTVLPYVVVSLVVGLGSLGYTEARKLALRGGGLLALLWLVTFLIVVVMPLSFPDAKSGAFFSTTLIERPPPFDVVALYVPSNPFESLANSDVPAVVLFSIAVGVALMGIETKGSLIRGLSVLAEALMRVTRWIVRLTPYGVFAIAASAAGTMTVAEFGKVQVYLVSYIAFALLLTFWILPGIVAALTGLPHREVAVAARDALITAFATGNDFVVLPLLIERTKELLKKHQLDRDADSDSIVDVVIPVSHNFPHTAKILSLSFVMFASWFVGDGLDLADYPMLGGAGVVSTFGSVNLAIPFLLDLFQIPSDLFNLFVATSVVNARFGTMLAAMHGFCLALLVTCALTGRLSFSPGRLLRFTAASLALVAATTFAVRSSLAVLVKPDRDQSEVFDHFELARGDLAALHVYRVGEPIPDRPPMGDSRIDSILDENRLRVCYIVDRSNLPFSYFEENGRLVGFDVEMAFSLARGLGTALDFVPIEADPGDRTVGEALASGRCDIGLGSAISMDQSKWLDYSTPYLDLTMALMVPDHRRGEFAYRDRIEQARGLRLAVPKSPYYRRRVGLLLPAAEQVEMDSVEQVLTGQLDVDGLVYAAEVLAAYSLIHPDWGVVVPDPPLQKVPIGFALPEDEFSWQNYVNSWIELKKRDGTIELLYAHWILGRGVEPKRPRWSIAHDVLGWLD